MLVTSKKIFFRYLIGILKGSPTILDQFITLCQRVENIKRSVEKISQFSTEFLFLPSNQLMNETHLQTRTHVISANDITNKLKRYAEELEQEYSKQRSTSNESQWILVLRELNFRMRLPAPVCYHCCNSCFAGIVVCSHVLPYIKPEMINQKKTGINKENVKSKAVYATCTNCTSKYRCPMSKLSRSRTSSSSCKNLIQISRFSLDELHILFQLALQKSIREGVHLTKKTKDYYQKILKNDRKNANEISINRMALATLSHPDSYCQFRQNEAASCGKKRNRELSTDVELSRNCKPSADKDLPLIKSDLSWLYVMLGYAELGVIQSRCY